MIIKTERLILEPLGMKHLKTVHEYASDLDTTKYMEYLPNRTIEETAGFLKHSDAEWSSVNPTFYEFAIIYNNRHVGAASIHINEDLSVELGWIVNKEYQRRGIAFEAATALIDYSIRELKIKRFVAHCDTENIASYKVMEKLGMSRTKTYGGRKNKSLDLERMEYQYELNV